LAIEALERRGVRINAQATGGDFDADRTVVDLLAAVRAAGVAQVLDRLARYHDRRPMERLAVSGGVAANRLLRRALAEFAAERGITLDLVPLEYAGDNAAMIAHAALLRWRRGDPPSPLSLGATSRLPIP
jgi:N6-L-threonylcarbamoyladenine synthase